MHLLLCINFALGYVLIVGNAKSPSLINAQYVRESDLNNFVDYINNYFDVTKTYTQTHVDKGKYYLHEGKFDLAERHFKNVLEKYPNHEETIGLLTRIDDYSRLVDAAQTFEEFLDIPKALEMATYATQVSPAAKPAYELKAKLWSYRGEYGAASDKILARVSTILQGNNTEEYYRLAHLLYQREFAQEAVKVIERCLEIDPENNDCLSSYEKIYEFYKHLSKGEKALDEKRYKDCITEANEVLKNRDALSVKAKSLLCRCYLKDHQPENAIDACSYVLAYRHDLDAYCNRAEALLQSASSSVQGIKYHTDYALHDYARVLEIDPLFERAIHGQSRTQYWSYVQRLLVIPLNLWNLLPISKLF